MGKPLLAVEDLSMSYRQPGGRLPVLNGLSFQVTEGEFVCLVGASGCGKTTLLRLVAGLERPTVGQVRLAGQVVDRPRRTVGLVFQEPTLMTWRTVEANVTLPLEVAGVATGQARRQAQALLDLVGLSGFEAAYPAQLSGGMAQRVSIARALIHDPEILLLDEPFGSLDALTRERMNLELLRIWQTRRKTVIMVTHNIQEAILLADRVLVMTVRPGQITANLPVTLPRPRSQDQIYGDAFTELARRVREAIDWQGDAGG